MANYICRSCGFRKEVKGEIPKKCPYCSKDSFRREENAEELLNE